MTLEITLLLHLHNLDGVLLRDVAGGRAEHVTTPRGGPLAGRAGAHCARGGCRFSETGLDILTVPGAGDTAVTELSVVTVVEEEAERWIVMTVVSIPGEPLTARRIPTPSLQVNDH